MRRRPVRKHRAGSQRAFALVVALTILVLLGMLGFGALSLVQFNQSFVAAKLADRRASQLLDEAARYVVESGRLPQPGSPPFEVIATKLSGGDFQVSCTILAQQAGTAYLGQAVRLRPGDCMAEFSATTTNRRRGAVYLLNDRGARSSPVLLVEKR
jgi:hypothetical protein